MTEPIDVRVYPDDIITLAAIDAALDLELLSRVVAATGLMMLVAMVEGDG